MNISEKFPCYNCICLPVCKSKNLHLMRIYLDCLLLQKYMPLDYSNNIDMRDPAYKKYTEHQKKIEKFFNKPFM